MAGLEGFDYVAVSEESGKDYYYAIYDDPHVYYIGQRVLIIDGYRNYRTIIIKNIIRRDTARSNFKKNITAEVICPVDFSAFENRVNSRLKKEQIRSKMDNLKKKIKKEIDDQYYAEKNEEYAALLREYMEL